MQYDIFISYSRADNDQGQVNSLVDRIATEFKEFAGRDLEVFFDTREISGGQYWQDTILGGLKESRLMLACLSPAYLASQWCEWEFNEYQKYELGRAFIGEGMAPIYFVEVPGFEQADFEQTAAAWVKELRLRQHYDLRPWYNEGETALQKTDVSTRLQELTKQVWKQVHSGEMADRRRGNLDQANERFVGRSSEMRRLHRMVGLGRMGVLTAVNGLGGIGKTALALQYAHAYGSFFSGGCWQIRCEGKTDIKEAFASLRNQRDLLYELNEEEKKSIDLQFERVLQELRKRSNQAQEELAKTPSGKDSKSSILILLDNVDKPQLLDDDQLRHLPKGDWLCLLATTRLGPEDLAVLEEDDFLAVDELPDEDGLALIESYQKKRRFKNSDEQQAALAIVRLLGGLPLAVEVAAVYMGRYNIPCMDFLARLQEDGRDYFATVEKDTKGKIRHGEKCLAITLQPTLERLDSVERLALRYAAHLPADQIPLPWLRSLVTRDYPQYGKDAKKGEPDPWLNLVRRLLSFRLLQATGVVTDDGLPLIVRMHRLVGEVLLSEEEDKDDILQILSEFVMERGKYIDENWLRQENRWEILPLAGLAERWLDDNNMDGADLTSWLSVPLRKLAYYSEAYGLLLRTVALEEQMLEPDHPNLATRYSNLALVEQDLGNLDEARILMIKAVAIENLDEARILMKKAVPINEKVFEPDHPSLATSYSNLAMVERDLGNLDEARILMKKAVAIYEKVFEPDHPSLATSYSNLAMVEKGLGNLDEARILMKKAVAIEEKAFEPDHPSLATSYNNLEPG